MSALTQIIDRRHTLVTDEVVSVCRFPKPVALLCSGYLSFQPDHNWEIYPEGTFGDAIVKRNISGFAKQVSSVYPQLFKRIHNSPRECLDRTIRETCDLDPTLGMRSTNEFNTVHHHVFISEMMLIYFDRSPLGISLKSEHGIDFRHEKLHSLRNTVRLSLMPQDFMVVDEMVLDGSDEDSFQKRCPEAHRLFSSIKAYVLSKKEFCIAAPEISTTSSVRQKAAAFQTPSAPAGSLQAALGSRAAPARKILDRADYKNMFPKGHG